MAKTARMPEYHGLSAILGIAEIVLAWRIYQSNAGALWLLLLFLYWDGVSHLLPAELENPLWWRYAWTPVAILRLLLAAGVSVDLFRFLHARTHSLERRLLVGLAGSSAGVLVVASWAWTPANVFQGVMVCRQYALLGLAVGTSAAWYYLAVMRPVEIPPLIRRHGLMWCCWLWLAFGASCTVKAGLLWSLVSWEGGELAWRAVNDAALGLQLLLLDGWRFSLRTEPRAAASRSASGPGAR